MAVVIAPVYVWRGREEFSKQPAMVKSIIIVLGLYGCDKT
jgi:uncharacterized membrane protein (DUF485 family)